jgi:hypothetical protein
MGTSPSGPLGPDYDKAIVEALKLLTQNIQSDNVVLNAKMTQYIAIQSLLVVALEQGHWNPYLVSAFGIITSLFWLFSMNTTNHYRQRWISKSRKLVRQYPLFATKPFDYAFNFYPSNRTFPWWARVSTGVVQIAVPGLAIVAWIIKASIVYALYKYCPK